MSGVKRYTFDIDERYLCDCGNGDRVIRVESGKDGYVTASDYDRDTSELRSAVSAWRIHYDRAMTERDEFRAQAEALRRVAMELRDYVGCEDVNHRDGEFHDFIQACPVLARIDAALQAKP